MKWIGSRRGLAVLVAAVAVFTIALGSWQGWLARAEGDVIWVNRTDEAGEPAECDTTTAKDTIAAALAEVDEAEDIVRLCKETTVPYAGNVTIAQPVTIEGDPGVSRDEVVVLGSSDGFIVKADGVTLQHMTLDGDNQKDNGVDNDAGHDNLRVKDMVIKDFEFGVWIKQGKNNVVEDSHIHGNDYGIKMADSAAPADGGNVVRGSTIENNDVYGIWVDGEYDARIEDNTLSGNGSNQIDIRSVNHPAHVHVWRNKITVASDGIWIGGPPANALIVIGGSEDNRNEFVGDVSSCGNAVGNCYVRLDCANGENTVDATYNNWGGASGPGEVTQGIWGNDDECGSPPAAAVVYRPWTTAAVPTVTPSPTPTPTVTATPLPTGTRDFSLDKDWQNFVWTGADDTDPATALNCIDGKYSIAYEWVGTAAGGWKRYVPGRPALSDMANLSKYDALFVLMSEATTCTGMPVDP